MSSSPEKGIIADWLAERPALVREAEESRLLTGAADGTPDDLARRFRHHCHALQLIMARARVEHCTLSSEGVIIWAGGAVTPCESLDDVEALVGLALTGTK